jgi:cobalt/nickel transport system permease protein
MKHAFIDTYADLNTPLHKLNAKTKIIFLAVILLLIIFSPIRYFALFLLYGLVVAALIYLSKVPLRFIFKRVAEIAPFIIIISISALFKKQGYILFLNCTVKAILAIALILIASSTIKFNHLLETLRQFKVPHIFIHLLSFMYRYSFLLENEFLRASRAYQSRNINNKDNFSKLKVLSNILGTLFIRTYERAERVYMAMCSRGYDNEKSS